MRQKSPKYISSKPKRRICQADEVQYALTRQEAVYQRELEQEILSVIDRKSDEFASIAQNVITSAAEKAASGNSFASTAVTVVSTGASVAKGVSEIHELKSYLLSGIHEKSARVASNLPSLEGLLESSIHGINGSKAHIVRTVLESRGVISGSGNVTHLQVDLDKFGFVPGLSVSRRSEERQDESHTALFNSNSGTPNGHPGHSNCHPGLDPGSQATNTSITNGRASGSHATNTTNRSVVRAGEQGIAITPFVFEELNQASQRTTSVSDTSPIRESGAGANTTEFGAAEKHRGQIYEVLSKVDAVNRADHNYDAQIDHMASHISDIVGDRMRGMMSSGIIRPITAPIVQQAASTMVDWTANWIESYANKTSTKIDGLSAADGSGEIISGVAAGDGYASPDEYSYDDEAEEAQEREEYSGNAQVGARPPYMIDPEMVIGIRPQHQIDSDHSERQSTQNVNEGDVDLLSFEGLRRTYNKHLKQASAAQHSREGIPTPQELYDEFYKRSVESSEKYGYLRPDEKLSTDTIRNFKTGINDAGHMVGIAAENLPTLLPSGIEKNLAATIGTAVDYAGAGIRSVIGDEAVDSAKNFIDENIPDGTKNWAALAGAKGVGAAAVGTTRLLRNKKPKAQGTVNNPAYKDMEKPKVVDKTLAGHVEELYRPKRNAVGTGSTASAVRREIETGIPVGGGFEYMGGPTKGNFHFQKARERIRCLERWLEKNPNALESDKLVAKHLILDLKDALGGLK